MAHKRTSQARTLRKNQTETEAILWQHLRAHRFSGVKFRRQYPIGSYIADFCAPSCRLIVEVDGSGHDEERQRNHDIQRDAWLRIQGWNVLRVWNNDIATDIDAVLQYIMDALPPLPADQLQGGRRPSPTKGRGQE